jgi:hypothetical protein
MIKRTASQSRRVKHLVTHTRTEYVECRSEGRHPLGKRVIEVDLSPGVRLAEVRRQCGECGTWRFETFRVRVHRDRVSLTFLERLGPPRYSHPADYRISAHEPKITRLDWLSEAINRDAREQVGPGHLRVVAG